MRKWCISARLGPCPEEGPSPEEVAEREAKVKAQEEKMAQWEEEKKSSKFAIKGQTVGGGTILSPASGKEDKGAMRQGPAQLQHLFSST